MSLVGPKQGHFEEAGPRNSRFQVDAMTGTPSQSVSGSSNDWLEALFGGQPFKRFGHREGFRGSSSTVKTKIAIFWQGVNECPQLGV